MKKKAYCCDASRHMCKDYCSRQVGRQMPVFIGSRRQRGHGLGSVLEGLFRRFVISFFQTHGKTLASDALKTGVNVAEDVLGGLTLKESVKKRVPEGIKRTAQSLIRQSGSGVGRRRCRRRKIRPRLSGSFNFERITKEINKTITENDVESPIEFVTQLARLSVLSLSRLLLLFAARQPAARRA